MTVWIHIWFHYHKSTCNGPAWIRRWIHTIMTYDFTMFYDHEFIFKFILWIYAIFHDHQFMCAIWWPMKSYMILCILRISWNHTWNHGYEGSRWWRFRICIPGHTTRAPSACKHIRQYGWGSVFATRPRHPLLINMLYNQKMHGILRSEYA